MNKLGGLSRVIFLGQIDDVTFLYSYIQVQNSKNIKNITKCKLWEKGREISNPSPSPSCLLSPLSRALSFSLVASPVDPTGLAAKLLDFQDGDPLLKPPRAGRRKILILGSF